jgi:hypothetical protein
MLIEPPRLRPSPATKQAAHVRVHQALHIKPVWLRLLLELLLLTVLVEMHSSLQISEATEESRLSPCLSIDVADKYCAFSAACMLGHIVAEFNHDRLTRSAGGHAPGRLGPKACLACLSTFGPMRK